MSQMHSNVSKSERSTGIYPDLAECMKNASEEDGTSLSEPSASSTNPTLVTHLHIGHAGIQDEQKDASEEDGTPLPEPSSSSTNPTLVTHLHIGHAGIQDEQKDASEEDGTPLPEPSSSYTNHIFETHLHLRGRVGIKNWRKDASKEDAMLLTEPSSSSTNPTFGMLLHLSRYFGIPGMQNTEPDNVIKEHSLSPYRYIISIITFIFCIILTLCTCIYSKLKYQPLLPQYLKEIENLRSVYDQQTEYFWDIIKSFPYYLLSEKNPNSPAVLLMVAPAGGLGLALQLTQQITDTLNKLLDSNSNHVPIINGSDLAVQDPADQKMMIDEQIRNFVENQEQRAVVVVNLEKIDPLAVMIFHAYCDNSEAVYKDIAIILLLELPAGVSTENEKNVFSHLTQIWSPLGRSTINALFTRLANNVVILDTK